MTQHKVPDLLNQQLSKHWLAFDAIYVVIRTGFALGHIHAGEALAILYWRLHQGLLGRVISTVTHRELVQKSNNLSVVCTREANIPAGPFVSDVANCMILCHTTLVQDECGMQQSSLLIISMLSCMRSL